MSPRGQGHVIQRCKIELQFSPNIVWNCWGVWFIICRLPQNLFFSFCFRFGWRAGGRRLGGRGVVFVMSFEIKELPLEFGVLSGKTSAGEFFGPAEKSGFKERIATINSDVFLGFSKK